MFYYINYLITFICRLRHLKGFGIQSPWAFKIVNDVINNHTYFPYRNELYRQFGSVGTHPKRIGRLLFRLSQYFKAVSWSFATSYNEFYSYCAKLGYSISDSRSIDVESYTAGSLSSQVLVISPDSLQVQSLLDDFIKQSKPDSILVVLDIHKTSKYNKIWNEVLENIHSGVSFDLFVCGLVFFDHTIYKQHYSINLMA